MLRKPRLYSTLATVIILVTVLVSAIKADDFTKCVEMSEYYKAELHACEKTRINIEQENKYLKQTNKDNNPSMIPFTNIKASHLQGLIWGVIIGVII